MKAYTFQHVDGRQTEIEAAIQPDPGEGWSLLGSVDIDMAARQAEAAAEQAERDLEDQAIRELNAEDDQAWRGRLEAKKNQLRGS